MACGEILLVASLAVLLAAATVQAQSQFQLLSLQEFELAQDPELLEFAAGFGERVVIEITGQQDVLAPLSEQVNAVLDCLPWLTNVSSNFSEDSIAWYITRLDNLNGEIIEMELPFTDRAGRIRIEGEFDRFLNITRTLVQSVSTDPTAGIYRCEVGPQLPENRTEEDSHSVNTTLWPLGAPPILDKDNDNAGPTSDTGFTRSYRIGADFCLHDPPSPMPDDAGRTDPSSQLEISCALLNEETNQERMLGEAFPTPDRTWHKDGVPVYTARLGDPGVFSDEFRNNPATSILADPDFGIILQPDGDIRIRTDLNASVPASLQAYQAVFGNWTCRVNNSLGGNVESTVIRKCGIPPTIPSCPESEPVVITPLERVIPVPCDVIVRPGQPPFSQGVQLNCTPERGDPPFNYVWYHNNEVVLSGVNASTILVENDGIYSCTVDNVDGMSRANSTVNIQLRCYTQELCAGPHTVVNTTEECCLTGDGITLSDGLSFEDGEGMCITCIVFGWTAGFKFMAEEQDEAYLLDVGYLKGADGLENRTLQFDVIDTPQTAEAGRDYRLNNTQNLDVHLRNATVQVTFEVDNIALEANEMLTLMLEPLSNTSRAQGSNEFLLSTIELTITDSDVVGFQFTESDYNATEGNRAVTVEVKRNLSIATNVTLRITPVNFTEVNSIFPDVPDFDPVRPIIAKSFPEDARDFSTTPVEVTFPHDEDELTVRTEIEIFDDEINEADEVFAVLLEVLTDVPVGQVDLLTQNASLCTIVDNDPTRIGFEFPLYQFDEQSTTANTTVFLIKENNRMSEQTFEVVVTSGPTQDMDNATAVESATLDNQDYIFISPSQFMIFPEEQRVLVTFQLFGDDLPEPTEGFLLHSSPSETSPHFQSGVNPSTTISIEDDDRLTIGFNTTFITVQETVDMFELCLTIMDVGTDVQLPQNLHVSIQVEAIQDTALEPDDYVDFESNPLNDFSNVVREQCFNVTIQDDSRFELTERFNLTASSTLNIVIVDPDVAVVEIQDNDVPIRCYSEQMCTSSVRMVGSVEECCLTSDGNILSDGISFQEGSTGDQCESCVVFGWTAGFSFQARERVEAYSLVVGYIKGVSNARGRLWFNVTDLPGTADTDMDYRIRNSQTLQVHPNRNATVQVTFKVDKVALESDETLTLTLNLLNTMELRSNEFLLPNITLTITDDDVVSFQFTKPDYRAREGSSHVLEVQRDLSIATDVTLKITPVNFTEANLTDFSLSESLPDVFNPVNASSFPEDIRDFNTTPLEITFHRDEISINAYIDVSIDTCDDEVNEADEVFVVLLTIVTEIPRDQVDLGIQNASICVILDNDQILIGFEEAEYSFEEQNSSFTISDSPIFLIKENNRTSQQTFQVNVTARTPRDHSLENATASSSNTQDYDFVPIVIPFPSDEQRIRVPFQLFQDSIPELNEGFQLDSAPCEGSPHFQSRNNPSTTIIIMDDDPVQIGFTTIFTNVSESDGQIQLCLNIKDDTELPTNLALSIGLETVEDTAREVEDYKVIDFSVDGFTNDTREQCFNVEIIETLRLEPEERFHIIAFPNDPEDPVFVSPDVSTVQILENALNVSTRGNDFVLAFFENNEIGTPAANLFVTTTEPDDVEVTLDVVNRILFPGTTFPMTRTVRYGERVGFTLPVPTLLQPTLPDIRVGDPDDRDNRGIVVTAADGRSISVYGINDEEDSSDAWMSLPCQTYPGVQSYQYFVFSGGRLDLLQTDIGTNPRLLIVPCEDETNVRVTVSQTVSFPDNLEGPSLAAGLDFVATANPGDSSEVSLNRLQTLLLEQVNGLDLTGTIVSSNRPISLFVGHECAQVPHGITACDILVEQVPPNPTWGTFFFTVPLSGRAAGEVYRIGSISANTNIQITCRLANDQPGQEITMTLTNAHNQYGRGNNWIEFTSASGLNPEYCCIESNRPVMVMQYSQGHTIDEAVNGAFGDPFMVTVPPVTQYLNDFTIVTAEQTRAQSFVTSISIAVPVQFARTSADRANISVNGSVVPDNSWRPINCSNGEICGYGTRLRLRQGAANVFHSNPRAGIYPSVYGFLSEVSFGYPAGYELEPIGLPLVRAEDVTVREDAGNVTINITRGGDIGTTTRVSIATREGSATENDYTPPAVVSSHCAMGDTATIIFRPGVDLCSVEIVLKNDNITEQDETFEVVLTTEANAFLPIPVGIVTILDEDSVEIGFNLTSYSVSENDMSVELVIVAQSQFDIELISQALVYTEGGNATGGNDYTMIPQNASVLVNFTNGSLITTVTIVIVDDENVEGVEQFFVMLQLFHFAQTETIFSRDNATVVIFDNDVVVHFDFVSYTVSENDVSANLTISKHGSTTEPVHIAFQTFEGTATNGPGADFCTVEAAVILQPNETMRTVPVPIMQDSRYEGAETFYARITLNGSYPGVQIVIADNETEVIIIDDDEITIQFAESHYTVGEEDGNFTLRMVVEKMGSSDIPLNASVTITAIGSITNESNFIENMFSIPAGNNSEVNVTTVISADRVPEGTQFLEVELHHSNPAIILGDTSIARVEIIAPTPPTTTSTQLVTTFAVTTSQAAPVQNSGSMNTTIIIIIAVTVGVLMILVFAAGIPVLILCIKRKSKTLAISTSEGLGATMDDIPLATIDETGTGAPHRYSFTVEPALMSSLEEGTMKKVSAEMVIPSKTIQLQDSIGQGEFGIVYKAHILGPRHRRAVDVVAVKTLKGFFDHDQVNELMRESLKMREFDHPNVLNLIGVCLDGGPAPYLVMPYMANGSLLCYLRRERPNFLLGEEVAEEQVSAVSKRLLDICIQIAKGMEYLATMKFVHRDLAARNCMIDAYFVIKVADFGLSENTYAKTYVRQGQHGVKLPLKWLAPECVNDGVFSEKSDVWAYGVTCWEIYSVGKIPYPGVDPASLPRRLERGERLEKPNNAAVCDDIYTVMLSCWNSNPEERPSFSELVTRVSGILDPLAGYMDFTSFARRNSMRAATLRSKAKDTLETDIKTSTKDSALPKITEDLETEPDLEKLAEIENQTT